MKIMLTMGCLYCLSTLRQHAKQVRHTHLVFTTSYTSVNLSSPFRRNLDNAVEVDPPPDYGWS